jgi:Asp-tRNA(Asn)/Glu-tRNA(Gln) amidotransferase A subunit family amidase
LRHLDSRLVRRLFPKNWGRQKRAIIKDGIDMIHQARDLSPEQRAAAELLLGRQLDENESISVQAFEPAPLSEQRRREVSADLRKLFAEVDLHLSPTTPGEAEEVFTEAMRSSRPGYRHHQ